MNTVVINIFYVLFSVVPSLLVFSQRHLFLSLPLPKTETHPNHLTIYPTLPFFSTHLNLPLKIEHHLFF